MAALRRVTCTLVNQSDASLIATGSTLNFKVATGDLVGSMPVPVEAGAAGMFTLAQASGATVGPAGWACYERANEVVFQIGFGEPSRGAEAFTIGFNYLSKAGQASGVVKFANAAGPIDPAKVAEELDLRVEYHLGWTAAANPGVPPEPKGQATQSVGGQPGGTSSATITPYIARWNQNNISPARKKVLAAIEDTYPMLWLPVGGDPVAVAAKNGGGTYKKQGAWNPKNGTTCTSSCPNVGGKVSPKTSNSWTFAANAVGRNAWIKWGSGPMMPSVGDVYLLYCDEYVRPLPPKPKDPPITQPKAEKDKPAPKRIPDPLWDAWYADSTKKSPHLRHVGIIVEVPTNDSEAFITADGGQSFGGTQAAHLVKRKFLRRKPGPSNATYQADWDKQATAKNPYAPLPDIDCLYLSGEAETEQGNRLLGWIDIDVLAQQKLVNPFVEAVDEALYQALGVRIDSMR